jgi:hypothetical protein
VADAVVIGLAKKVKRGQSSSADEGDDDAADDAGMSLDEAEDDAVGEMAEILGVEEGDRDAFKSALSDFVRACMKRGEGGEY